MEVARFASAEMRNSIRVGSLSYIPLFLKVSG